MKKHSDNNASVESLHRQPFGTISSEEIELHKLNTEDVEVV